MKNYSDIRNQVDFLLENNKQADSIELLKKEFVDKDEQRMLTFLSSREKDLLELNIQELGEEARIKKNTLNRDILHFTTSRIDYHKRREENFGDSSFSEQSDQYLLTVFFAHPTPFNDIQQAYIDMLLHYFSTNGILLDTLTGWDEDDPLAPIIEQMKKSSGCCLLT